MVFAINRQMSHSRAIASNLKVDVFETTLLLTFLDLAELQQGIRVKLHNYGSSIILSKHIAIA